MITILSFILFFQCIAGVPVPRVITRWHTAEAVTSTAYYTTGTTTVWLPPVQVDISGDFTTTYTVTTGQWATTPVTLTSSHAAGQPDTDQPEPTHTDNFQPQSSAHATSTSPVANTPTQPNSPTAPESTNSSPQTTNQPIQTSAPSTTSIASTSSSSDSATSTSSDSSTTSASGDNVLKVANENGYDFSSALIKLTKPSVIVYSPYSNDGSCKNYDEVETDLKFLKSIGINKIRTYGVDCNIVSAVLPIASSLNFKVNQGFWISNEGVDSIDDSVNNLIDYAKKNSWDVFDYITIGNEAIIEGYAKPSELIAKIKSVKKQLQDNGYTGQVTTSEPPAMFIKHPELCTESDIDFVGINSHSYFNTNLFAHEAGEYITSQQKKVSELCSKKTVITETGYPSKGIKNGNNVPSLVNQYAALKSIMEATNGDCTILSSFDDYWKNPGPYGIEQSFGVIGLFN